MTRPSLLLAFAATAVLAGPVASQTPSVEGLWRMTWETPRGEQTFEITLAQTESGFTGTAEGPMGREWPVRDGTLSGDSITFVIEMTAGRPGTDQTRTVEQVFKGLLTDEGIAGEVETPAMGRGAAAGGRGGMGGPRPFRMIRIEG